MKKMIALPFIIVMVILTMTAVLMPATAVNAADSSIDLVLLPSTQSVDEGEGFSVEVQARCGSLQYDNIRIYIDFTPKTIIFEGAENELNLDYSVNSNEGVFDFTLSGIKAPFPSGDYTVLKLYFYAGTIGAAEATINFHTTGSRSTGVSWEGQNIAGSLTGCSVIVNEKEPSSGGGSGGGGGGNVSSAPSVKSVIPLNKATDVPVDANIKAIFSQAMNPVTINNNSFLLTGDSGPVSGAVTYDRTSNFAMFNPDDTLAPGSVYSAKISTAVKDTGGKALSTAYSWSFTTQDGESPVLTSTSSPTTAAVTTTTVSTSTTVQPPLSTTTSLTPSASSPLKTSTTASLSETSQTGTQPGTPDATTQPPSFANWGLVVGIMAALVIIVLVLVLVVRKKRNQHLH